MDGRSKCSFISGPMHAPIKVPGVKWWLAISRDELAKTYRRSQGGTRVPVSCHLTPTFCSPLRSSS